MSPSFPSIPNLFKRLQGLLLERFEGDGEEEYEESSNNALLRAEKKRIKSDSRGEKSQFCIYEKILNIKVRREIRITIIYISSPCNSSSFI